MSAVPPSLGESSTAESVPCLSLSFWCHQQSLASLSLQLYHSSLHIYLDVTFCVCVCVCTSSSYKDTDHIGLRPTLLHYDPILTNYIFNTCFQERLHSEVMGIKNFNISFRETLIQPVTLSIECKRKGIDMY